VGVTAASLTLYGDTSPVVWGTGLTLQEKRNEDVSNIQSLRQASLSTFNLSRATFHVRKHKEYSINSGVRHSATREKSIIVADVHGGIQSFFNKRPANFLLEEYDFGDAKYTPRTLVP